MNTFIIRKKKTVISILFDIAIAMFVIFFLKDFLTFAVIAVLLLLAGFSIVGYLMELHFFERELLIKNDLSMSFRVDYRRIIFFGKVVGSSAIYIAILYKGIVPLLFRSRVEVDEMVPAILNKLASKTGKGPNVIAAKKKKTSET